MKVSHRLSQNNIVPTGQTYATYAGTSVPGTSVPVNQMPLNAKYEGDQPNLEQQKIQVTINQFNNSYNFFNQATNSADSKPLN